MDFDIKYDPIKAFEPAEEEALIFNSHIDNLKARYNIARKITNNVAELMLRYLDNPSKENRDKAIEYLDSIKTDKTNEMTIIVMAMNDLKELSK